MQHVVLSTPGAVSNPCPARSILKDIALCHQPHLVTLSRLLFWEAYFEIVWSLFRACHGKWEALGYCPVGSRSSVRSVEARLNVEAISSIETNNQTQDSIFVIDRRAIPSREDDPFRRFPGHHRRRRIPVIAPTTIIQQMKTADKQA